MKVILNFSVSLIIFFVFLEVLCRFFWEYNTGDLLNQPGAESVQSSPEFSVKVKINGNGLRDQKYTFKKKDNVFRIVVIGDSITYGWGVEAFESYPKVLEQILNQSGDNKKYEVINISRFGAGPIAFSNFLEFMGLKYHPDLVLVTFFPGNDLNDDLKARPMTGLSDIISSFMKRNFYSSFFVLSKVQQIRRVFQINSQAENISDPFGEKHLRSLADKAGVSIAEIKERLKKVDNEIITNAVRCYEKGNAYFLSLLETFLKNPSILKEEYDISTPEWKSAWDRSRQAYKKIKDLCFKNEADMMILLAPASFQINDLYLSDFRKYGVNLDDAILEGSRAQEAMNQFCSEEGIKLLDFQPAFKKDKDHEFFFVQDGHWNREGHRFAAEVIFDRLKNADLIMQKAK